jgi:pyruvate dehydrogenase E1 component alpha subunit
MKGSNSCALVFFGDGATSEGAFHEGLTFAGVVKAPVVLFCNNNGWAMSTPVSAQTGADDLVDKAVGYGIEAVQVDGGDVLAVYNATTEAIERARAGEGATLIEAITYRMAPHSTADDLSYMDQDRVQQERQRECLTRYEKLLASFGVLTEDEAAKCREVARAQIRTAMAAVERVAPASPAVMFDHVYAEPPLKLLRDKAAIGQERRNQ